MTSFWLAIRLDLSEKAVDGPGWYIYAAREGAVIIPPQRINEETAEFLGEAFYTAFDKPDLPVQPNDLIESGSQLIADAIQSQLAEAEAHALRIAKLRRLKAELESKPQKESEEEK